MAKRPIKFGVKNVHIAKVTEDAAGAITYGTPFAAPGIVALTLDPQAETVEENADDITWFYDENNNGYNGNAEFEQLPDEYFTEILGWTKNTNGVLIEKADAVSSPFAIMFEFTVRGDATVTGKRGCMFYCYGGRPSVSGNTKTNTIAPDHESVSIRAIPRPTAAAVKASALSSDAAYASWFTAVPEAN